MSASNEHQQQPLSLKLKSALEEAKAAGNDEVYETLEKILNKSLEIFRDSSPMEWLGNMEELFQSSLSRNLQLGLFECCRCTNDESLDSVKLLVEDFGVDINGTYGDNNKVADAAEDNNGDAEDGDDENGDGDDDDDAMQLLLLAYALQDRIPYESELKGTTPILQAAFRGNLDIVKYLVLAGSEVVSKVNSKGMGVLELAFLGDSHVDVVGQHKEIIRFLVDSYPELDLNKIHQNFGPHDGDGTMLHQSVLNSDSEMVQLLLDLDADVNARDKLGRNPLLAAALNQRGNLIPLLLDCGADPNARDNKGISPTLASMRLEEDWQSCLELMVAKGGDIHAIDELGQNAVMLVLHRRHQKVAKVKYLVETQNVDVQEVDRHGRNVLHHATVFGTAELVKFLLDMGATDRASHAVLFSILRWLWDKERESPPLPQAHGVLAIVSLLLKRNISNVNSLLSVSNDLMKKGDSALSLAVEHGYFELAQLLLENGASLVGGHGEKILQLACEGGNTDIVRLLVECGNGQNLFDC